MNEWNPSVHSERVLVLILFLSILKVFYLRLNHLLPNSNYWLLHDSLYTASDTL